MKVATNGTDTIVLAPTVYGGVHLPIHTVK